MSNEKKSGSSALTKECLYTALVILMEQKPYAEITITEIAKKAGVSRMSYYRLYKSKDDILIQYFNDIFEECLEQIKNMKEIDRYQFAVQIFEICGKNHVLLENVFHAGLYELVLKCLLQYCSYLAVHIFKKDLSDSRTEYWVYGEAGRFSLFILGWLKKKMPESPEQMAKIFLEEEPL